MSASDRRVDSNPHGQAGHKREPKLAPREPKLTPEEQQDFLEQVEEFEGPSRREKRGTEPEPEKEPGVERA